MTKVLNTEKAKASFEKEGYIIISSVFNPEWLSSIRKICDEIIACAEINNRDIFSNYYLKHRADQGVLYDLYQRVPEFSQLARNQKLIEILSNIYSPNFFLYENSLVYKPKGGANAVPWHQDFINRPNEPIKAIAWIAIDNVTQENGCMYAIPESHKLGFLPYFTLKGETHHTRINMSRVDESKAVPLEMKAGDVLIFNQLLIHCSKEVHTDLPRRAYRAAYQNFEKSFTPRGTPIVISLKDKSILSEVHNYEELENKSILRRGVRKIGRIMANF
ncbi:MAG: phytanoyl-CoA dioxygenase family protein [Xenococcaceae cyanobacterium MO_207.B15]|nr:phytanoyl-CoA dioxygenase family protein [Xenococcaceae cyanobacterium MO_207.B15]MDJ0747163.1 phytanoyl-CoA dioxygenase family protein [Xenococcaceae cyanobacterium MO_167.B27]